MFVERMLDFVPFSYRVHRLFERGPTPAFVEVVRKFAHSKVERWQFFLRETGTTLEGMRVLDIGTGWVGNDLLICHLLGAGEIVSIDTFPHLNTKFLRATVQGLLDKVTDLEAMGVTNAAERLAVIPTDDVDEFLKALNVRAVFGREVSQLDLQDNSFDLFFTHSTLQNLKRDELERTMDTARRVVRPGGFAFNDVRFIDNNFAGGRGMNQFGFLRHSDRTWALRQSKKFNYHNRLRHCEFIDLFDRRGFRLVTENTMLLDEALVLAVKLDRRFAAMPVDDLRIGNATMIHRLEKPA